MVDEEAINYMESLQVGEFCTVNIPIYSGEVIASTCIYMGKDEEGRYVLKDQNCFKMSKEFMRKNKISIDKDFDGDKAFDIYTDIKKEQEKQENQNKKKNRNRDAR